ncbi:hypothetical protein LCGC14_0417860 [marine sediment metagenome]|uniref:Uncharacterized protein n=1 Tax=marine sediment metagenome TaxID=412755 RepID=A0A0F9SRU8_9ZZZZ
MSDKIDSIDCSKHKTAGECGIEGCTNMRKANGPCPKCGVGRYKRLCRGKTCPRRS